MNWKVAIIGAGYMALEHARAFSSIPNTEIVGICGRNQKKANDLAEKYGAKAFCSVDDLYENTMPDVVVVAVNELSMKEVCAQVFQYPWICLLEKPVGINYEQAVEIQSMGTKYGVRAYVAFNRRSYSSTLAALELIEDSESPRLISILDQQDMSAVRESGQPEEVVKNYMYANSIHLIDYFHIFGRGSIEKIDHIKQWDPENPSYVVAAIRFSSGDLGLYQGVWNGPGPWGVNITNSRVRAEMRPLENLIYQEKGSRALLEKPINECDTNFKPGLFRQASQIIGILNGKNCSLATLAMATESMKTCKLIYQLQA